MNSRNFQIYLRVVILSALFTYLLSLAAGAYYPFVYQLMFEQPKKMIENQINFSKVAEHKYFDWFFQQALDEKKGVVTLDPGKTYGDYTFFASAYGRKAYLVDLKGNVVHEWTIDWAKIFPPQDRREGVAPLHTIVGRAFLQPNGDVLAEFVGEGGLLGDYGLVKVDKDSKLIWKYDQFANHDICFLPNGHILTFIEEFRNRPLKAAPFLRPPFIEPFIAELDADGHEVKRTSIFEMFARSPQRKLLWQMDKYLNPQPANGDILHPNTITMVTPAAAAREPVFEQGQFLISLRNISVLAQVDLDLGRVTWASFGPWRAQHSPRFTPDGSVMLFDNLGNMTDKGAMSRVLNVDPVTGKVLWQYDGTDEDPFYNSYNGDVDPLPNGNVLATITSSGRIFEVTRDKEIVWDYRAPQRVTEDGYTGIPSLFSGRRYRREDLPFLDALAVPPPTRPEPIASPTAPAKTNPATPVAPQPPGAADEPAHPVLSPMMPQPEAPMGQSQ